MDKTTKQVKVQKIYVAYAVNQDRLITIIRRTVKDGDVVSLIMKYLKAGVMENGNQNHI